MRISLHLTFVRVLSCSKSLSDLCSCSQRARRRRWCQSKSSKVELFTAGAMATAALSPDHHGKCLTLLQTVGQANSPHLMGLPEQGRMIYDLVGIFEEGLRNSYIHVCTCSRRATCDHDHLNHLTASSGRHIRVDTTLYFGSGASHTSCSPAPVP